MQKIILLSFFLLANFLAQAQLYISSTYSSQQGRSSEEIAPSVTLKNNGNYTIEVRWERIRNNLPQGWDAVVCDKQCSLAEAKTFTLASGESISNFRVSFRPNGVEGIGNTEIKIYEVRNPGNSTIVNFSAAASNGNNMASISGNNAPTVYPNPAIDHIMIQDANNEVKFLEVYNVVGRKIEEFTVNGGKYDVSELPLGMYMVRMLDKNKNIIRTQRISKYNP